MKKIIILLALVLGISASAFALTYEEAFAAIKGLPEMKGVEGSGITGHNELRNMGISDGQLIVWSGETGQNKETEVYGNAMYKVMGELPVSEMVKCRVGNGDLFAIFAKSVSADKNRILILSDSAGAGFTAAVIGYIGNDELIQLRNAILIPREEGGTAVYLNAINF